MNLIGKLLSENKGALLLTLYASYLVVMAVNGIVECFSFSTMNASSIMRHARFLLIASLAHLATNILLLNLLGSPGFILANISHMIIRIAYNWRNIKQLPNAQNLEFSTMIPDFTLIMLLLLSLIITGLSGLVSPQKYHVFTQTSAALLPLTIDIYSCLPRHLELFILVLTLPSEP